MRLRQFLNHSTNMTNNKKILIGLGVGALLLVLYKMRQGSDVEEKTESELKYGYKEDAILPKSVPTESASSSPQVVVTIPPQFGGGQAVETANVPSTAGSWQSVKPGALSIY